MSAIDLGWRGDPCELVVAAAGDDAARLLADWIARHRPGWQDDAACLGHSPELFFPERGRSVRPALAICGRCPVMLDCRADALADPSLDHGVRGGMTPRARASARNAARKR